MHIIKLDHSHIENLQSTLSEFPVEGSFFLCDLEHFGISSDFHCYYGIGTTSELSCILLHYYDSVSIIGKFPIELQLSELSKFFKSKKVIWVNGFTKTVSNRKIFEKTDLQYIAKQSLLVLQKELFIKSHININVEKCTNKFLLQEAFSFINSTPEFETIPSFKRFLFEHKQGIRQTYFVKESDEICGSASMMAINSASTMIAALSVIPSARNKGIATNLVTKLSEIVLEQNKIPFLLQDYDIRNNLYSKIGYTFSDTWCIFKMR